MILLIHSFPKANDTLKRHWPYFINSGAREIQVVGTMEGECWSPPGIPLVRIGADSYINGTALPQRLLDTLEWGLQFDHEHIMIAEYDCLFLAPIRFKEMEHSVASHRAGSETWGSKAKSFYHNPWLFKREAAKRFIEVGKQALTLCTRERGQASTPESSPDVFVGYVTDLMEQPVQDNLWTEFSRNSFDIPGDLERAREARKNRVGVIHGIKTQAEYDYIFS